MKSEHHHQILRIGNILGTPNFSLNWIRLIQKDQIQKGYFKFQLKLTIFNFWTKSIQKRYFQTKKEKKKKITNKLYIFELI